MRPLDAKERVSRAGEGCSSVDLELIVEYRTTASWNSRIYAKWRPPKLDSETLQQDGPQGNFSCRSAIGMVFAMVESVIFDFHDRCWALHIPVISNSYSILIPFIPIHIYAWGRCSAPRVRSQASKALLSSGSASFSMPMALRQAVKLFTEANVSRCSAPRVRSRASIWLQAPELVRTAI